MCEFYKESERLKSFDNWPHSNVSSRLLAKTGLYYTGSHGTTFCYFCNLKFSKWQFVNYPVKTHYLMSPHCKLLNREHTNNIPIDAKSLDEILPQRRSFDVCGTGDMEEVAREYITRRHHVHHDDVTASSKTALPINTDRGFLRHRVYPKETITSSRMSGTSTDNESIVVRHGAYPEETITSSRMSVANIVYPQYSGAQSRLASFKRWPRGLRQKPEELASVGLYYTGFSDDTICFCCGIQFNNWEVDDIPFERHIKSFKPCPFIELMADFKESDSPSRRPVSMPYSNE